MLGWVVKEVSQAELGRNHSVLGRATFIFFAKQIKAASETDRAGIAGAVRRPSSADCARRGYTGPTGHRAERPSSGRPPPGCASSGRRCGTPTAPAVTKHQLLPAVHSKLKVQN